LNFILNHGLFNSTGIKMKKIYTIASVLIALSAGAQSQRMVLMEEFTQASCGPCAAANPAYNNLLNNNTSKVVSIKYQTNWPGVDPMNAQYPSAVSSRVNYYGLNSVPYAVMDGAAVSGSSYLGYPGNLTQTKINNEYAVPSPFDITVAYYFDSDMDSIFITATITATQSFTAVNYLRAHIVMLEQEINFANPPGSNGETDFYGVCRKMFPSASGNALPLTWAAGDDSVFHIAAAIPSYIYDVNEIAVVCFVQDNGNKEVKQSAITTSPVGIHTYTSAPSSINLFPNPASEQVTIQFTQKQSSEVVVNIYNAVGELVSTQNKGLYSAGEQQISLSIEMLASGMYSVELISDEQKSVSRLNVVH